MDQHYQLALPWRFESPFLPKNKAIAEKSLGLLRRRFEKNKHLFAKYKTTVADYIDKGHARMVPEEQLNPGDRPVWYLPHHPVIHPQKPGKVSVVFDCASKFHGTSLNDQLLQGPDLTNSLVGVLLRFRQEPMAMIADVEQMFHQVMVKPEDCDALRFLWWPDGDLSKDPVEHQMLVHLFGATSSQSCASFALKKTANDNKNDFDVLTIDTVNRNFYVDDCLKSVPVVEEAVKLVDQLPRLLARGGFHLTKWVCNRREVLDKIPSQERAPSVMDLDFGDQQKDRALGIEWNILNDSFGFRIAEGPTPDTRRGIHSRMSN